LTVYNGHNMMWPV